jgi:1-pyrroline-4-hydroxy-2-carboxylate deaminase
MERFPGIQVAVITPFGDSGEVDYERLAQHADWLIENGVHGLVSPGTVGEYASLTNEERGQVVETVVEAANGRVPVTAGVAAPSTAATVGWAQHALDSGAAAVMALPPINYNPTRREVVAYYQAISDVGLPIAAYNNPYDTATDLTPEFLAELSEIENFVAVKDFSGDVRRMAEIRELCDLEVIAGVDDLALEGFLAGATGCIAGFANALPKETVEIYDLAQAGKLEAWTLYRRMLPLLRYDTMPRLVQAIKYAMELAGVPAGGTRPPRLPLEEDERREVQEAFAHFGARQAAG